MRRHLKNYFIPHPENDHQPHFLRDKCVGIVVSLAFVIQIVAIVVMTPSVSSKLGYIATILPAILVEKTNSARTEIGGTQLMSSEVLASAARLKANDMAEKGYFSHVSPDGTIPWYWIQKAGYEYTDAGENLAVNFVDSDDVHDAWMNSPGHRANILRDGFTEIGIATAEGTYKGKSAIFVVQYFAKPKVVAIEVTNNQTTSSAPTVASVVQNETPLVSGAEVLGEQQIGTTTQMVSSIHELTWYDRATASPRTSLTFLLKILAGIIALALILKIFIKRYIQFPKLILNGALAFAIIMVLIGISHMMGGLIGGVA